MTTFEIIQIAALNCYNPVKKNFVKDMYRRLRNRGLDCYMVNDLYICVEGVTYQFINRRKFGIYEVQEVGC